VPPPDWFIVNLLEAPARSSPKEGAYVRVGGYGDDELPQFGVNFVVVWPGQTSSAYHAENLQEDFLVVSGECLAIVEDEEVPMKAWDFLHCPPGTRHVFVGAGEGPCTIVMVGARDPGNEDLLYPVSELAARFGAQSKNAPTSPTSGGPDAYEGWPEPEPMERLPWPPPDEPV
jgi:uncharacterized cupin superfamily protein